MNRAARGRRKAAGGIDILVQSHRWSAHRGIKAVLRRAVAQAAVTTMRAGELAVVLTDDDAIRVLNRDWRRKDQPTNVLSFPAARVPSSGEAKRHLAPDCLGDIVIAYETTAREANAERKLFDHHVAHLAVHGFLHLIGYDHDSAAKAKEMERLEVAVLARLRVPNPYVARNRIG